MTTPEDTGDDFLPGLTASNNGLDLSEEGLASRGWDDANSADPDEVEDDEDLEESEPDDGDDDQAEEEDEPAEDADDSEDPAEPVVELPEKFQGKTQADIVQMYLELEKLQGSRASEVGDLRSLLEAQQAQMELLRDAVAQQQSHAAADDLVEMVRANPTGTYNQAIQALDRGQITIDVVEEIIDEVEAQADELTEEGHTDIARQYRKLSRQMQRDFDRRLTLAETHAKLEPVQQQTTEAVKRQAYEQGVAAYFDETTYQNADDAADAKAYQQDVQNLLKGKDLGDTPQKVAATLKQALFYVRGMNPSRSAAFVRQQQAMKSQVVSERGSAEPPAKQLTEQERIRQSVFKREDPSDVFFKDFAVGPRG